MNVNEKWYCYNYDNISRYYFPHYTLQLQIIYYSCKSFQVIYVESAKLYALRTLVPYVLSSLACLVPRALLAFVPHLPRVLRTLGS